MVSEGGVTFRETGCPETSRLGSFVSVLSVALGDVGSTSPSEKEKRFYPRLLRSERPKITSDL